MSPLPTPRHLAREMARIGDMNYLAGRWDERDRSRALERLEREPRRAPSPRPRVRHGRGLEGRGPRGLLPYPDDDAIDFDRLSLDDSLDSISMPRGRPVIDHHGRVGGSPPRPRYDSFSDDGDRLEMHHHHVPAARHHAGLHHHPRHYAHDRDDRDRHYHHRHVDIHHTHRREVREGEHSPRRDDPFRYPNQSPFNSGHRYAR